MEETEKKREKENRNVSVMNWIGTLILCGIPGVNILALLAFVFFAKTRSKRNFAGAALILILFTIVLVCAAFLLFPDQLSKLASELRGSIPQAVSGGVIIPD